jgi:hypothetical protein
MKHPYVKSVVAALLLGGLLGGCATTVEMGGPLAYYRYHYETGAPVTYSTQPAVVYQEPATVYRERTTVYRQPTAVYREPTTVYREPTVYSYRDSASRRMAAYSYDLDDHGQ